MNHGGVVKAQQESSVAADVESSSDSESEVELDPRRARAIELLAKALHRPGSLSSSHTADANAAASDAQQLAWLRAVLAMPEQQWRRTLKERERVLAVRVEQSAPAATAHINRAAKETEQHERGENSGGELNGEGRPGAAGAHATVAATAAMTEPDCQHQSCSTEPRSGDTERLSVRSLLMALQSGDTSVVNHRSLQAPFWEDLLPELAAHNLKGEPPRRDAAQASEARAAAAASLRLDGHCALPPVLYAEHDLALLEQGARRLKSLGWPPLFIFMFDAAWALLDSCWESMQALLGDDCALDPSVFCWIARSGAASAETAQGAGLNFGLPHRDFTYNQSVEPSSGEPLLLSVWLPLNAVSVDNGCMMVVPRQLDPHFCKRWAYAHMRPALPADEDGMTEVRFDLQSVRALSPLAPGSLVAWYGNVIHWGTSCAPSARPRVAVGFNFLRAGQRLQRGFPPLTREQARQQNLCDRLRIIARSLLVYSPWFDLDASLVHTRLFREHSEAVQRAGQAEAARE